MKAKSELPPGFADTSIIIKGRWNSFVALNWHSAGAYEELFCFSDNCMMKIGVDIKKTIMSSSINKLERKLSKSYFHDDNKMEKQIKEKTTHIKLEKKLGTFYKIISFFRRWF